MYAFSKPAFWYRFFKEFVCYNCGSHEGYVSRPRNLFERYGLRLLWLRSARCGDCYLRSYLPARVPLMPRPEELNFDPESMLAATLAAERKVSQKETKDGADTQQRIA
jgi:hypothetical protein